MSNLVPKEMIEKMHIPKLYEKEDILDPIAHIKLFLDGWTWYITEISIDGDIAFGYVLSPFCTGELGYFSINEIQAIKNSLGIGVERDLSFKPTRLSIIKKVAS
jgi:hypothetical protein